MWNWRRGARLGFKEQRRLLLKRKTREESSESPEGAEAGPAAKTTKRDDGRESPWEMWQDLAALSDDERRHALVVRAPLEDLSGVRRPGAPYSRSRGPPSLGPRNPVSTSLRDVLSPVGARCDEPRPGQVGVIDQVRVRDRPGLF